MEPKTSANLSGTNERERRTRKPVCQLKWEDGEKKKKKRECERRVDKRWRSWCKGRGSGWVDEGRADGEMDGKIKDTQNSGGKKKPWTSTLPAGAKWLPSNRHDDRRQNGHSNKHHYSDSDTQHQALSAKAVHHKHWSMACYLSYCRNNVIWILAFSSVCSHAQLGCATIPHSSTVPNEYTSILI